MGGQGGSPLSFLESGATDEEEQEKEEEKDK
jgi:hypothetical protein